MRQVRLLRFGDMHRTRGSFHGGYTMKTKKKIALATLAAAMLATASLGIFAYAHDVAPLYVTHPCLTEGCNSTTYETNRRDGEELWTKHYYNGRECYYDYKEVIYDVVCGNGHDNGTHTYTYTKNHSYCGMSDQY